MSVKVLTTSKELERVKQTEDIRQIEISEQKHAETLYYSDYYAETMNNLSMILHPFCNGNKINSSESVASEVHIQLDKIEDIVSECKIRDKHDLLKKVRKQVDDLTSVVDIWNDIVNSHIKNLTLQPNVELWFRNVLLPKTYWTRQLKRTKYKLAKSNLKVELEKCNKDSIPKPESINEGLNESLKTKADELCRKFQRTSSQVEGRNGYLSMVNHNQRGFDEQRLKVLTVVHNFDTYSWDGETPAQRLFGDKIKHDKIIDYLIRNFGDLPLPRKRTS